MDFGYHIGRYNGRYYVSRRTNPHPSELGQIIVDEIPKVPELYAKWLEGTKEGLRRVEERIFGKNPIAPIQITNIPFEECLSAIQGVEVVKALKTTALAAIPSYWPTINTTSVPWTYTIDVDREIFSINHATHLPLSEIPSNWVEDTIADDWPDDTMDLVNISRPKPEVEDDQLDPYDQANCDIFEVPLSDIQVGSDVHKGLCFEMLTVALRHIVYFNFVYSWGPEDPPFKQLAFLSLCLADRSSFTLLQYCPRHQRRFRVTGYQDIAYPTTTSFWFAGVFVYLTTDLDDDLVREVAIGQVLELIKESGCPRTSFTVFLFSIDHLVVIDVSEEGVKHTNALPFWTRGCRDKEQTSPNTGVLAMITYLARSRSSLAACRSRGVAVGHSCLPYDVLTCIVEFVDWKTALVLSETSRVLRDCVERSGPKIGEFKLLKYTGPGTFIGRAGDGRIIEIDFEAQDWGASEDSSSFVTAIRYPGVRQRGMMPVINLLQSTPLTPTDDSTCG